MKKIQCDICKESLYPGDLDMLQVHNHGYMNICGGCQSELYKCEQCDILILPKDTKLYNEKIVCGCCLEELESELKEIELEIESLK
jgi:hypothetical protein